MALERKIFCEKSNYKRTIHKAHRAPLREIMTQKTCPQFPLKKVRVFIVLQAKSYLWEQLVVRLAPDPTAWLWCRHFQKQPFNYPYNIRQVIIHCFLTFLPSALKYIHRTELVCSENSLHILLFVVSHTRITLSWLPATTRSARRNIAHYFKQIYAWRSYKP